MRIRVSSEYHAMPIDSLPGCRICGEPTELLFRSDAEIALLSSATPVFGSTLVHLCPSCAHAQTEPVVDVREYYSSTYRFRMRAEDEDDLYDRVGEHNIYRSDHQASVAEMKLDFSRRMRVMDYGCAKARSLKLLVGHHAAIQPYVFDVSDSYRKYWEEFVPVDQQASFSMPDEWLGTMDVVLSFFALEHVEDPHGFVAELRRVLRPQGKAFIVVPNVLNNFSDVLVVDHINHFSVPSLETLLNGEGFTDVIIDDQAFRGAFVVCASRAEDGQVVTPRGAGADDFVAIRDVAEFWRGAVDRVRATEASCEDKCAIYGSGIYGQFIATILRDRGRVACFLDQNPWRQGASYMDIPVRAPADIPDDVRLIYVGLNPLVARQAIRQVKPLHCVPRNVIYL